MGLAGRVTSATEEWVDATIAGMDALCDARPSDAASCWIRAADTLDGLPGHDPRVAAGRSNAGAAALLLSRWRGADTQFAQAEAGWLLALDTVDVLDVPVGGRSSSFHFRLASRHLDAFAAVRRRRYRELLEAALAITRFNRLLARSASLRQDIDLQQVHTLHALLAQAFGPSAPEVRLLSAVQDGGEACACFSSYAYKAADCAALAPSFVAWLSEACGRFEAATRLAVLLVPAMLPGAPGQRDLALEPGVSRPFL